MAASIVERKIKAGGRVQEFDTELTWYSSKVVVVAFRLPTTGTSFVTPLNVPPGSVSYGYFWRSRPYNLYRFIAPDGRVVGHRFDAVTDVQLSQTLVSYRDLLLDWYVFPDGRLIEEDRDEFEEARAAGILSPHDEAQIDAATRAITSRYRRIIDEAAELQRRHA